jgi:hypothetical protein
MSGDVKVDWHTERVILVLNNSIAGVLKDAAIKVANRAAVQVSVNNQVDTGFMMNAIYAIWADGSNHDSAEAEAKSKADRPFADAPPLPDQDSSAVHGAAEYTVYQEMINSFMYRAFEQYVSEYGGSVEKYKF